MGFSRSAPDKNVDDKPDAWAFSTPAGRIERIEVSSTGDESQIDRWEFYDVVRLPQRRRRWYRSPAQGRGGYQRRRSPDKWERYVNGLVQTAEFDENRDGRPDRRLTYRDAELVLIETAPDSSGRYTKVLAPK